MKKIFSTFLMFASLNSFAAVDCHVGEVMSFAGNFVPRGFKEANGGLLPINQYPALFSIIGTMYGGDGVNTFALPNLTNRSVVNAAYNEFAQVRSVRSVVNTRTPITTQTLAMKQVICVQGIFPSRE